MRQLRWLLPLSFILSALTAHAEDPTEYCADNPECSSGMISITENYKKGFNLSPVEDLTGFSGVCFHLHPSYDAAYPHTGAFVFEKDTEGLKAFGIFGFFYNEDPYANMSAVEMKKDFVARGSKSTLTKDLVDHRELIFTTPATEIRYWFRTNDKKNILSIIGRHMSSSGGIQSVVFCNMVKH